LGNERRERARARARQTERESERERESDGARARARRESEREHVSVSERVSLMAGPCASKNRGTGTLHGYQPSTRSRPSSSHEFLVTRQTTTPNVEQGLRRTGVIGCLALPLDSTFPSCATVAVKTVEQRCTLPQARSCAISPGGTASGSKIVEHRGWMSLLCTELSRRTDEKGKIRP
jgi:hypothetical protein